MNEKVSMAFSSFFKDRFSGYMNLTIETKTPMFIRGGGENFLTLSSEQGKRIPIIPGSSLRGMARTLVEIVSFGKFINYDNKIFYRRSSLTFDGDRVNGGFLKLVGDEFLIFPAKYTRVIQNHQKQDIRDSHIYREVNGDVFYSVGEFMRNVTIWKFSHENGKEIVVPEEVIQSYINDEQRADDVVDLVLSLKKGGIRNKRDRDIRGNNYNLSLGLPVFYRLGSDKKIISLGHAKYHRIPHRHCINRFIPELLSEGIDFAETIFGTTSHAGRVYFEDAVTEANDPYLYDSSIQPKILASPKPTTHQHFLVQHNPPLKYWTSSQARIRAYKLYWHRSTPSDRSEQSWVEREEKWRDNNGRKKDSFPDPIRPVKPGTIFKSRIRFENLTAEELGCLGFVMNLPSGHCHKLGMCKPLGLGSVEISTTLNLHDRCKRYKSVFTNDSWSTPELADSAKENISMDNFKASFENYILARIPKEAIGLKQLWDVPRLKELLNMLLYHDRISSNDWLEITRYMEIERMPGKVNEYKRKPALPHPSWVVNGFKK